MWAQQPLPHINEHWKGSIPRQEDGSPWVEKGGGFCVEKRKQIPTDTPGWSLKNPWLPRSICTKWCRLTKGTLNKTQGSVSNWFVNPKSFNFRSMNWLVTACLQGLKTTMPRMPKLCSFCSAKQTGAGTSPAMSFLLLMLRLVFFLF